MSSIFPRPNQGPGPAMRERTELAIIDRVVSSEQLQEALTRERAVSTMKLGARLLELNLISEEQLQGALRAQSADPKRHLGEILLDLGLVSRRHLYQVLCEKLGIPFIDLARFTIDPAATRLLPEELVRQSRVFPLCRIDGKLVVAVSDPLDSGAIERVRFYVQGPVTPVMARREEIEQAILTYYGPEAGAKELQGVVKALRPEIREAAVEREREHVAVEEPDISVVGLVNRMIADAYVADATHLHIDMSSGPNEVIVRRRSNGELTEYLRLPAHMRPALVARIKTMAGIDVSERRHAHDGRIEFISKGAETLHLRVLTIPTRDGNEDIAMELLASSEPLPLNMLGLRDPVLEQVRALVSRSSGLILAAGPTGSGRTTLAHALLTLLDEPKAKVWTVENTVQIMHPGSSQIEVNAKIGWDAAAVTRAVVRADPDVIMIDEIRDRDTAASAVEASLKGCLVLATLHAHSAAEAVARLLDMGIDAFSLSDALLGVVGQRLARRLCGKCRSSRPATPAEIIMLLEEYCDGTPVDASRVRVEWKERFGAEPLLYAAKGCDLCAGTGYHGRIGLHEVLDGPAVRELMVQRRPFNELAAAASREGMRTLKQDGIEKALAGHCNLREVRAATL